MLGNQTHPLALVCSSYLLGVYATFPTKEVCIKQTRDGFVQSETRFRVSAAAADRQWLTGLGDAGIIRVRVLLTEVGSADGSHPQLQAEALVGQVDDLSDEHDRLVDHVTQAVLESRRVDRDELAVDKQLI